MSTLDYPSSAASLFATTARQNPKAISLKTILFNLVRTAQARDCVPAIVRLPRGLRISVTQTAGHILLNLSRDGVYPAPTEWATVIKHWPWPTPPIEPHREVLYSRHTLSTLIRLPMQLFNE